MNKTVYPGAEEADFGGISTDASVYRPLDTVTVLVAGRRNGDDTGTIRVYDRNRKLYHQATVSLTENHGSVKFTACGLLGVHFIYLHWAGEEKHSRYVNFRLECDTSVETGDPDFDALFPFTREKMLLGRREYRLNCGKMVGYVSADSWCDGIWLRDWIYGLPAYRLWEREMACGLDRFLEKQTKAGMLPDGIKPDGQTWRVGLESDVEYIAVLGAWQTWQVTGDDIWLAEILPGLEKALHYIMTDPKHWDEEHRLVKRQHSCDTWDFDIDGAGDSGEQRYVIATCDQSGYYRAFQAMGLMSRHLGREKEAAVWEKEAEEYRARAIALLWDGTKFRHHVHLDRIDHNGFDEENQLAMGNTWAMTRGLAGPEQAVSIIDEYRRRHLATGDAYPWWSLQPGYPDELQYFQSQFRYLRQGGYANGGLMPWVGGELCRAAFLYGREEYGVHLLRQYAEHLKKTGGAQVWYWPDGTPGFRTTNEVPYASWGMAEWLNALIEGLAGLRDRDCLMEKLDVSLRWSAAKVGKGKVFVRYAASDAYFGYAWLIDESAAEVTVDCCGSGSAVNFSALLPEGWVPKSVLLNGSRVEFETRSPGAGTYVSLPVPMNRSFQLLIKCTAA